ncbi:MAG: acyl-ACP--UDP-N-acetylglucosamine O-acyltransferase [Oligoflexales bacterium]
MSSSYENSAGGTSIHPTVILGKNIELGRGVSIGPYAIIGDGVKLGDGVWVGAHAAITGNTTVGEKTKIHSFASIGSDPQDLKYKGEPTQLVIGKNNNIREYVNISLGTVTGGGITRIGDNNLIMVYSHIAHDCHVGNNCILANSVHLAGHIHVEDNVVFGGMAGGHQFCRFGKLSMIGAGSIVVQDVAPYTLVQGDHAETKGLNVVGLRRAGVTGKNLKTLKDAFKMVFRDNLGLEQAAQKAYDELPASAEKSHFLEFLKATKRGICR